MITPGMLKDMLEDNIPEARVQVADMTGTMDHYHVDIVSPVFEGKSLIEQHKLVHAACGEYLGREIHALQIKTSTP